MSLLNRSSWRRLAPTSLLKPRSLHPPVQRRWAQVHDVRFLTTHHSSQAVLEKYRAKLDQKARAEGHDSIDSLKAAYTDKILAQRKKDAIEIPSVNPSIPQAPDTPVSQPNRHHDHDHDAAPTPAQTLQQPRPPLPKPAAIRGLDELLNLEKIRELPEREITALWRLRHAESPSKLCAVIPAATYAVMEELANRAPRFVLPVPHETQGAEIHYLQWVSDAATRTRSVLFTQLAEYKTRDEFAQPHTTITHHLDLAADKGLVLMQGQIVDDRGVKPEQARWLIMCLQRFYGALDTDSELNGLLKERARARRQLVEWFSVGDSRFSVEKLLEETERMG